MLSGSEQSQEPQSAASFSKPLVVTREHHVVSRKQLSPNALKVLYRLKDAGYDAYLVGGCIRDILLGLEPKDFDVVTNATPEQIKKQFRNCRLIGRRFRLAHIMFGREIIEVATMRGHHSDEQEEKNKSQASEQGQLLRDNVYGTIDEDAERRDFSINALYYSINDFSIHDFAGGMEAIKNRRIELIGDPETRYREDPVRMLRAVRFATKLDMTIAPATEKPIFQLASLLGNIPAARLFEEMLKLFLNGKAEANFNLLRHYGLFSYLFPALDKLLNKKPDGPEIALIKQVLSNTDKRINAGKKVTPAYLIAAFLWYPLQAQTKRITAQGETPFNAFNIAMNQILSESTKAIAVPKRFTIGAREIWQLQHRFDKRGGQRAFRLTQQPRFRAAKDFFCLRAQYEPELTELAAWWDNYTEQDAGNQKRMVGELNKGGKNSSFRRRRPRKPKANNAKRHD
ncbi:polynucleotide adenylyltransferase PcnB [Pseudoalteromonas sp. G4]|uniref:polynucleotide adenylyltransferase PcnB n=1 Tax=Pseudoalteromonas sp. G4 TaxID=2992761 RepID=UPI00237D9035|nr:polynucleotide adenylyltransferase PcnB [Pseudoalteromonas sp. G4]MDE3272182.1 polynucleotide adenylyltransferase PcnB [Pseudoalteromonas sp. G4]